MKWTDTYLYSTIVKGLSDIILMVQLAAVVFFLISPTAMLVVRVHKP
jgi:hypothetical protein